MEIKLHWYAVYTRPRNEKKLSIRLDETGIVNYCPLQKVQRNWSDRKKIILEPLFKGYLFIQVPEKDKWELRNIDGIVNFVYWLGKPAIIKDIEIENIKKFLNEFDKVEVHNLNFKKQDMVTITQGVLMDYKGSILEIAGNKALVRIERMGLVLSALIEKKNLALLKSI
ncbi:MAG: UpxY family transcription antiterminator [Niastella sp.]|nr:UpxY family transcription antiterminator [Niastella sp.]